MIFCRFVDLLLSHVEYRFSDVSVLTIFIHACLQTFLQAARPALVSVGLVHGTRPLTAGLTDVLSVSPDGSLKIINK